MNSVFAAEQVEESAPTQENVSTDSKNFIIEKVLRAAETNKDILNYMELVDTFITAERIPTNRWDTPANVYVITAQEIEDNHYQDLPEALSHVPGIGAFPRNFDSVLTVHGTNRVVLLIDGHRATIPQAVDVQGEKSNLSIIPSMKIIERIEIIKGSYSALYGADAFSGVINIITKKGERNETTVDFNAGSWKTRNFEVTNQGVIDDFSWFATIGFQGQDYFKTRNSAGKIPLDYRDKDFSIRLDKKIDDSSSLSLSEMYRDDKKSLSGQSDYQRFQNQKHNNFLLSYNFKENTSTPGYFRYFHNYNSQSFTLDHRYYYTLPHEYGSNSTKYQGIEYQNGWEFGNNKLIAGAELQRVDMNIEVPYFYKGHADIQSFYLQDTITVDKKWTLVPGIRFDHYSGIGSKWTPKIAANYRADDKTKFYATVGKNFNPPSKPQLYGIPNSVSIDKLSAAIGNPNLTFETGTTEMLGFEHNFDDNTNLTMNFFHMDIKNYLYQANEYEAWSLGYFFAKNNPRKFSENIFEASFRQNINDNLSYDIGYTRNPDGWIKHLWKIGLHYKKGKWKANLSGNLGVHFTTYDNYWDIHSSRVLILDFNASYSPDDNTDIYFRTTNFTNLDCSDMRTYYGDYSVIRGTGVNYMGTGKFFQIGAQYKF